VITSTIKELMTALVRTDTIVREQRPLQIQNTVIDKQLDENKETILKAREALVSLDNIEKETI